LHLLPVTPTQGMGCVQTAAEEAKRKLEQTEERLRSAESERDALVQALKEQQDSKDAKQEVPIHSYC
jgi:uncharacterized damage-inducible protein DinB